MKHKFNVKDELVIVKDLSGDVPEAVGCEAAVKDLLPAKGKYPQYLVLVFGKKGVRGGLFEVDERELGRRNPNALV